MSKATFDLQARLSLDSGKYTAGAQQAAKATDSIGDAAKHSEGSTGKLGRSLGSVEKTAKQTEGATGKLAKNVTGVGDAAGMADTKTRGWRDRLRGLQGGIKDADGQVKRFSDTTKLVMGSAIAIGVAKLGQFTSAAIGASSALGESINAVEQVFGASSSRVLKFSEVAAQAAGLSRREFNQLSTVTGALLKNVGFSLDDAAGEAVKLTLRAGDMASVFDTDVSVALEAVNSALKGEMNPIEQFGVKLNDATVRAKAVEMGLADTTAAVDDHGKAVATLATIYDQTNDIQGDFLKTNDSLANAQRVAAANYENAQARLGDAMQGPAASMMNFAADAILITGHMFGDEIATRTIHFGNAVEHLNKRLKDGVDAGDAVAHTFATLSVASDVTGDELLALGNMAGLTDDEIAGLRETALRMINDSPYAAEAAGEIATAFDDLESSSSEAADGMDDAGGSAATMAEKLASAEAAQRALITAQLEALDPAARAAGALQSMAEAEANLDGLQKNSEATARDVAQAQLDYAISVYTAQAALDEFDASGPSNSIGALQTALGLADTEARTVLDTLGLLDGKEVTTVINVRTVQSRINNEASVTPHLRGGRSGGGRVGAGELWQVGEGNRPELYMIPGDNGRVFSNSDTRHLIDAFSATNQRPSAGDVSIAVNYPVEENIATGVRRGLQIAQMMRAAG